MNQDTPQEGFKKVTLKDVALAAQVSYASVSAVLGQKPSGTIRVSAETREKIQAVAKDLGYVPNLVARSLKGGKNSLIAVFTYEKVFPVDPQNEFYPFFVGIEAEAERQGFDLLILNNRPLDEGTSKFSRILMADGAIMIGIHRVEDRLRALVNQNFPIVFVGRREIPGCQTSWVTFDYQAVIVSLVRHLVTKGVRQVLYVRSSALEFEPSSDRESALRQAAQAEGLELAPQLNLEAEPLTEGLERIRSAQAVVFDQMTTALRVRQDLGATFGTGSQEVAILEDDWLGQNTPWTHWSSERERLGSEAVRQLVAIIEGTASPPVRRLVPLQLIPRTFLPTPQELPHD